MEPLSKAACEKCQGDLVRLGDQLRALLRLVPVGSLEEAQIHLNLIVAAAERLGYHDEYPTAAEAAAWRLVE